MVFPTLRDFVVGPQRVWIVSSCPWGPQPQPCSHSCVSAPLSGLCISHLYLSEMQLSLSSCFSLCLCISQSLPLCVFSLLPPLPLCLGLSLFLLHAPSPFCIIRLALASSQSQPSSRGSSSRRGRRSSPGSRAGSGVEYRQSQEPAIALGSYACWECPSQNSRQWGQGERGEVPP